MVHKQVLDWDSLVSLMKQEFTPSHSADILWKQILNRTQGANESIGIYVATMTCLFDRMPISVSNELRLKVLRDINTTTELINYCRKLEETKLKVKEFNPPQEGQLTLEPDLDYNFIIGQILFPIANNDSLGSKLYFFLNCEQNSFKRPRHCVLKCPRFSHLQHVSSGYEIVVGHLGFFLKLLQFV
ncbi:hypothetical protein RN001_015184 [Aquatica leii]|uniref:Retrotransposon gag domain-containing protein n=1 Tax=Aquatica leii TaxID=1421715 RepID=A0AAN7PZ50_9COLE|nr:hypothetical protein RN001_015184 [Aquatica leii]